jgi:hypothetical protein
MNVNRAHVVEWFLGWVNRLATLTSELLLSIHRILTVSFRTMFESTFSLMKTRMNDFGCCSTWSMCRDLVTWWHFGRPIHQKDLVALSDIPKPSQLTFALTACNNACLNLPYSIWMWIYFASFSTQYPSMSSYSLFVRSFNPVGLLQVVEALLLLHVEIAVSTCNLSSFGHSELSRVVLSSYSIKF